MWRWIGVVGLGVVLTACVPESSARLVTIEAQVRAGPTCPVVTDPPDPACADRPVEGAVLLVLSEDGREVTRATSDASGTAGFELEEGSYLVVPQPVSGLLGTPGPAAITVVAGASAEELMIVYDTGIR